MPKPHAPLTHAQIKSAKPRERPYKLADGRGLTLLVTPAGGKIWRLRYRFAGREKMLSLGIWPDVSLSTARERREEARKLIARCIDPSAVRQAAQAAESGEGSFAAIAREWHAKRSAGWAASTKKQHIERLQRYVLPYLGNSSVAGIGPADVLAVVRRIEERGKRETTHRVLQLIGQVMRYAVATGRAQRDPTADLRGALAPANGRHFPAVTDPARVGEILRMIDTYPGAPTVRAALRLAPYLFVRPGELRQMRWEDVDLGAAGVVPAAGEWRYTATKTSVPHIVPLAPRAAAIIEDLRPLSGGGEWVFLGLRGQRPISDMALGAALRRLGIDTRTEHTVHGWRATARTLLHEVLGYPPDVIEHQLAHRVPDRLGGAYNRTKFLGKRREMMTAWADYLDSLREGAQWFDAPLRDPTMERYN
jgi:integrase